MTEHSSEFLFYGFQYPHHGAHSGFSALAREMSSRCQVATFAHPNRYTRILGRLRLGGLANALVPKWFEWNEKRALNRLHNGGLIHYFFPEDSLRCGAASMPGVKTAVTCHQPLSFMRQLMESSTNPGFFRGLQVADLVILMSDGELDEYRQMLPNAEVCCIRHGIDTDFFHPPEQSKSDGIFRILTVGSWLRDYATWAETANRLKDCGYQLEFTVIANKKVQKQAREWCDPTVQVRWLTGISDQQLAETYQQADALFLPLEDAWANNALLEAMASGLPVVCTDLPATREYLGPDGIYVAKDPALYADSLLYLMNHPEKRRKIGETLRARACEQFSWPIIAKQHIAAYDLVISD